MEFFVLGYKINITKKFNSKMSEISQHSVLFQEGNPLSFSATPLTLREFEQGDKVPSVDEILKGRQQLDIISGNLSQELSTWTVAARERVPWYRNSLFSR